MLPASSEVMSHPDPILKKDSHREGLDENVPHRLRHLNTKSPDGGAVWGRLWDLLDTES